MFTLLCTVPDSLGLVSWLILFRLRCDKSITCDAGGSLRAPSVSVATLGYIDNRRSLLTY